MSAVADVLYDALCGAARQLRETDLPAGLVHIVEGLAGQTHEQCVVAVVGQVNAGKSTFVNALLGGDLAVVGELETTATINYFRHGRPADPSRPVRCHWAGGSTTWEDAAFLRALQGNDEAVLRRATGIHHLEYLLEHPLLRSITLVDTPGTNAAVDEHQDRVAEYMSLTDQMRRDLRDRHQAETDRLGREADAVIYVTGAIARADQRAFLEEFQRTTQGRSSALNAVGVITKIEVGEEYVRRGTELAAHFAAQLRDVLNTVVPVGAGVARALPRLERDDLAGLRELHQVLRRIPAYRRTRLLASDTRFLRKEYDDCPVTAAERRALFEALPKDVRVWPVFAAIARAATHHSDAPVEDLQAELVRIANMDALYDVLQRHLLARGHILRAHRILLDATSAVDDARRRLVEQRVLGRRDQRRRTQRMLAFVRAAPGDPATAREISELIEAGATAADRDDRAEHVCDEIIRSFEEIGEQLAQYNADFEALQALDRHRSEFCRDEIDALEPLLGMHGLTRADRLGGRDTQDEVAAAQVRWQRRLAHAPPGSVRRLVYERAYIRCGFLLDEVKGSVEITSNDPWP